MTNWLCIFICFTFSNERLDYDSDAYIKIFAKSHLKCHCMSENKCKSVLLKVNFLISAPNPWKINGNPSQQFSSNAFFPVSPYRFRADCCKILVIPQKLFSFFLSPFPGTHWLQKSVRKEFSKCGPWTGCIGLAWELVRNVESLALLLNQKLKQKVCTAICV